MLHFNTRHEKYCFVLKKFMPKIQNNCQDSQIFNLIIENIITLYIYKNIWSYTISFFPLIPKSEYFFFNLRFSFLPSDSFNNVVTLLACPDRPTLPATCT